MPDQSLNHDVQKERKPLAGPAAVPVDLAPNPSATDPSRNFRHEFRNTLHAILVQVRCAQLSLNNSDTSATREHLAQIEAAVTQSRQLLDEVGSFGNER
ncbi:hypothetical protein ACERK3_18985 [Phycisphaerales bacterium AB-hyl4]|uniref:Signal transduction histidine kinase dimerisation/phosphoacceptor domain-containing protein n=1 Tax=Natronomicrosphaera hydrolytica TaxID=3242702 RepID=A0ABV4U9S4_9BACT